MMSPALQLGWILIFVAVVGVYAENESNDGDVNITQYPYIVSIRQNGRHVCSGAILDKYHVITSDRCVPPYKHAWNIMNNIFVYSGTSSLKAGGTPEYAKEMFSQNNHFNPTENPISSGLGMIKLLRPLKFEEKVKPIELSATEVPPGAELEMVGWMIANRQGQKTSNLKKVTLEAVNREECKKFYEKPVADFEFCTKAKPENNFCKGDSGSLLIYEGKLAGLVTYGISCEEVPVPDIHRNINNMREFISENIGGTD